MSKTFAKGPIKGIDSKENAIKARILIALGSLSQHVGTKVDRRQVLRAAGVTDEEGATAIGEMDNVKALQFNGGLDTLSLGFDSNKKRVVEARAALSRWEASNE